MIAVLDGSTAIVMTRPDATAGPIDRAFRPENVSAGTVCAPRRGTESTIPAHTNAMNTLRSMAQLYARGRDQRAVPESTASRES
jgi:hypothetical protein